MVDPSLGQALAAAVPQLYRSVAALSSDEYQVARGMLYGGRCVWVGNGFAHASKVAFKVRQAGCSEQHNATCAATLKSGTGAPRKRFVCA